MLVLATDLRGAIGFSSFAVLAYYAIANASAYWLPAAERLWPRWLAAAGLGGCALIAFTLQTAGVLQGLALFLAGIAAWLAGRRRRAAAQ